MTVQRWDCVWREESYIHVKDIEGPFVHYSDYAKLERKVGRLEKRLLTKKKFETMDLIEKGATAEFRANIDAKDQAAMRGE